MLIYVLVFSSNTQLGRDFCLNGLQKAVKCNILQVLVVMMSLCQEMFQENRVQSALDAIRIPFKGVGFGHLL